MAHFKVAAIGEMIDDLLCPECKEYELELVGIHLFKTDKPLVISCHGCGSEFDTNEDGTYFS